MNESGEIVIRIRRDGEAWQAIGCDFVNLMESPCGFGSTPTAALFSYLRGHEIEGLDGAGLARVYAHARVFAKIPIAKSLRRLTAEQEAAIVGVLTGLYGLVDDDFSEGGP